MPFTKEQVRRRAREISNANEAELEQPPQKRRRQCHGYNIFVKDVSSGLTLGLGKKTYASYASNGALMFWAKRWYEDKKPNWKKIYAEKAMEERVELPPLPEKLKTKTKSVQSSIRTRCSPEQLVQLNAKLSEGKRDALIKQNPFQTLLSLSCPYLHREFVMELVERFNPKNRTLEFRNGLCCRVTEEDVARVLGFPIGHIVVPTECEDIHRDKVEEDFPNLDNAYKAINLSHLKAMIEKENVNDDVFHRAYMLFALGCLLCPTTKDVVGSRLFPGVYGDDNMEMMKAYKWPAFILDWLANEIQNYKDRESKQRPSQGKGVGGSLFILMIIYFDLYPLTVDIAKEGVLPIAAWTKELIDERISLELEDKPTEELVLTKFPPHNMKNPVMFLLLGFIKAYKDLVYNFERDAKNLRDLDAEWSRREELMNASAVRATTSSPKEDGPSDFNFTPKEADVDERPEFSSFIEEDEVNVEGHNVAKEVLDSFENVYGRRTKGAAASTHPSKRRGVRPMKKGQSTQPPYVAAPPFKLKKLSRDEKKLLEVVIRKPNKDGPMSANETCIKLKGAKWPLTFQDVHESFSPRGLVSKIVMHTVRDWLMMKENKERPNKKLQPRRHIFHPDFALILPVLVGDCESGHWFCVVISLVDLRTQVLDSMKPIDSSQRTPSVEKIRNNFFELVNNGQRVLTHTAEEYKIEYPQVQQQDNCHDCGIYVIKFMDLWKGRMASAELDHETVTDVRRRILASLLMDEMNEQRESIIQAVGLKT
ncbi:hypothetical protein Vadar_028905 [Vaccinium darrowii]|uniref:Uncharacterized protein n=1 Tax=Vaccinium darrowii TaxID=229202 RepID=A0ACB7ZM30_9ERIC|nr:hypothetical protein Vadar_028905 [Vaccinium darrowii]